MCLSGWDHRLDKGTDSEKQASECPKTGRSKAAEKEDRERGKPNNPTREGVRRRQRDHPRLRAARCGHSLFAVGPVRD